jgi:diguanylate cyclase (GGDEF)-like protein
MVRRLLALNVFSALILQLVFFIYHDQLVVRQFIGTFIPLILSLLVIAQIIQLVKTKHLDDWPFWGALFIAMLFYVGSYLVWAIDFIKGEVVVSTRLSFGLWVMVYPFLFYALIYKIVQLRNKNHVYQYLFHIITLIIIIFALVFHYVFEPFIIDGDMTIVRFFVLILEPLLSVLLMIAAIVLYFLSIESDERWIHLFFVLGFLTQALAEMFYVFQMIEDSYVVGQFTDVLWIFAILNILAATYLSRKRPAEVSWRLLRLVDHEDSILPYIWIVAFTVFVRIVISPTVNALSVAVVVLIIILIVYQLLVVRRNTELLNSYEKVMYLTPLTGLRNRTSLMHDFPHILKRIVRLRQTLALVVINLDRFKNINDGLGREYGDVLLKEIAKRLALTIDRHTVLYHLGADEFALLVYNKSKKDLIIFIEQLTETISEPVKHNNKQMNVTASIGVSLAPKDAREAESLFQMAEHAMHQAKSYGKNQYFFFDRGLKQQLDRRLLIENELKFAANRGEISVYYQPKYMLQPEALVGFEALFRWHHETLGFISPAEAIPIAEETGHINLLGYYILDEVMREVVRWQRDYQFFGVVSVNVSAVQLRQMDFYQQVKFLLEKHNLNGKYIELELTESVMMTLSDVLPKLEQLKTLGLKISLDDFGTGYSSLFILKELPIDTIKIDQSFVRTIDDARSANIVKTILDIGSNLGLQVIAEGIEDTDSLNTLTELGCLFGQGYYYARPMPLEEVAHYIKAHYTTE